MRHQPHPTLFNRKTAGQDGVAFQFPYRILRVGYICCWQQNVVWTKSYQSEDLHAIICFVFYTYTTVYILPSANADIILKSTKRNKMNIFNVKGIFFRGCEGFDVIHNKISVGPNRILHGSASSTEKALLFSLFNYFAFIGELLICYLSLLIYHSCNLKTMFL